MKNFLNYFLMFFTFASILFLASCGEDDELPLPGDDEITLTSNSIVDDTLRGMPGDTVYVTANLGIGSEGDIVVTSNGSAITVPSPNTIASGDSIAIFFNEDAQPGATAELTFASEGINEQLIALVEAPVIDVTIYEATLLYAPTADANSETFFSTTTGETYSYNEVVNTSENISETIDFGYFYGQTTGASLQSADNYTTSSTYDLTNWTTQNTTTFRTTTLTAEDFDAITESQGNDIEAYFETGTELDPPTRVSGLEAGDVVAFTTEDGRFGLIKVVEVTGTFNQGDNIEIEVKVTNAME